MDFVFFVKSDEMGWGRIRDGAMVRIFSFMGWREKVGKGILVVVVGLSSLGNFFKNKK